LVKVAATNDISYVYHHLTVNVHHNPCENKSEFNNSKKFIYFHENQFNKFI